MEMSSWSSGAGSLCYQGRAGNSLIGYQVYLLFVPPMSWLLLLLLLLVLIYVSQSIMGHPLDSRRIPGQQYEYFRFSGWNESVFWTADLRKNQKRNFENGFSAS